MPAGYSIGPVWVRPWWCMTNNWQRGDRFLELRSRWMTLLGEYWLDHQGQTLEYWRVERAHSVIVLPLQGETVLLPPPAFRPGVGSSTYDFPGGRLPEGETPQTAAIAILQRELGVELGAIDQLVPLNPEGWVINSSFSNQRLYGWVAAVSPETVISPAQLGFSATLDIPGTATLLKTLTCLQCRALLLEYLRQRAQQDSNL